MPTNGVSFDGVKSIAIKAALTGVVAGVAVNVFAPELAQGISNIPLVSSIVNVPAFSMAAAGGAIVSELGSSYVIPMLGGGSTIQMITPPIITGASTAALFSYNGGYNSNTLKSAAIGAGSQMVGDYLGRTFW